MDKRAIAESMLGLQDSLIQGDLATMFEHIHYLEIMAGENFAYKVLDTFIIQLPDVSLVKMLSEWLQDLV